MEITANLFKSSQANVARAQEQAFQLKQLLLAAGLTSVTALNPTAAFAAITELDSVPLDNPIEASGDDYCYLITDRTKVAASQASWGIAEQKRRFIYTPWAEDGNSAALASDYTEFAFLDNPPSWNTDTSPRPNNPTGYAKYNLEQPENAPINNSGGLFYYQGSSQRYYTNGTGGQVGGSTEKAQRYKVNFYLGTRWDGCGSATPGGGGDFIEILSDLPPEIRDIIIDEIESVSRLSRAQRLRLLGRLIDALLLPRNVVAANGLATQAYVNDLAETILERLPSRQFKKIQIDEEIIETEIKDPAPEPVRGLWKTSKVGAVDAEIASVEIDGDFYVENPNLTSIYTEPNGTRVWARGFGGSKSPYETGGAYGKRGIIYYPDVYNNFYSTHGGIVVGVDTSLTENIQLGIFGNYGDIDLQQFSGRYTGSGSWKPSGFGGGVMASYWEDNFYLQGLFGATAFSGENKRQIKLGSVLNETYTATKDTTSYVGALRVGAPLTWGGLIVEPQATAIWNNNQSDSYKESGKYRALALKLHSYSDNFLETTVGAKLAWPIKQGTRNLLVPNLKVAWLADWDTNNGKVKFQRAYSRRARKAVGEIPFEQETQNGVLLEGGVDYSIFQSPTSGWKLYAKGGAKIWADASTDWRTSGGITFQF